MSEFRDLPCSDFEKFVARLHERLESAGISPADVERHAGEVLSYYRKRPYAGPWRGSDAGECPNECPDGHAPGEGMGER